MIKSFKTFLTEKRFTENVSLRTSSERLRVFGHSELRRLQDRGLNDIR